MAEKLLSFSEFLSVLVEPKLRPVERYVHVHTGDSIGFICTISEGDPPITFQWTKDGKSASSLPNINVNEGNGYSSTLVISQSTSVHRGMYSCIAINSVGFSINIMNLEVDGNQVVAFFLKIRSLEPFQRSLFQEEDRIWLLTQYTSEMTLWTSLTWIF